MPDRTDAAKEAAPAPLAVTRLDVTLAEPSDAPAATAPDSPAAATPAAGRGLAETTTTEAVALATLQGSTAEKIDQLHREMFAGSALGHHTELWNLVHAFKERVKALVAA